MKSDKKTDKTDQLNIRPDKNLISRLERLAVKFNKKNRNKVAVEILEQYIDFWEELETEKREILMRQRATLKGGAGKIPVGKNEEQYVLELHHPKVYHTESDDE